jgi:hypothetical protein
MVQQWHDGILEAVPAHALPYVTVRLQTYFVNCDHRHRQAACCCANTQIMIIGNPQVTRECESDCSP